jgi:hypothetical protein
VGIGLQPEGWGKEALQAVEDRVVKTEASGRCSSHLPVIHPLSPRQDTEAGYVQVSTARERFLDVFSSLWATSELLGSAW